MASVAEAREAPRHSVGRRISRPDNVALGAVAATTMLLLWSRLSLLGTSFWHDEVYTASFYVNRGPRGIFFGHYEPNNHVLFSLLSWVTTGLLGRFEASYRIWSVLPGLAAVGLAGWWAWRRLGRWAGVAVVVLATVSPVHLELARQARGYGLGFLAGMGMLAAAVRASDRGGVREIVLLAAFGLIGICTLPVFVLAFAAQVAALLVVRPGRRRPVLVATGVVGLASLAFYAPLLSDLTRSSRQEFGSPLAWHGVLTGPFTQLARSTLGALVPHHPHRLTSNAPLFALYLSLVVLGARRLWRAFERALLLHLALPVVVTYLGLVVFRFHVAARFASFLLFHVLVLLGLGLVEVWRLVGRSRALASPVAIAYASVAMIGAGHVAEATRAEARVPLENFKQVGEVVRGTGITRVVTNSTHPEALWYYAGRRRVQVLGARRLSSLFCRTAGPLVFVDHHFFSPEPDTACLRGRHAARVHVNQRTRGSVDVWIVPAALPRSSG